ncbi:hypothetical protein [Nocardia sp. NPDC052112]|uniref:hypothetical protein n=1 Tax=Nocardia sp. NPDC052112 TaxID=3155646 RepID=UPI00343A6D40
MDTVDTAGLDDARRRDAVLPSSHCAGVAGLIAIDAAIRGKSSRNTNQIQRLVITRQLAGQ